MMCSIVKSVALAIVGVVVLCPVLGIAFFGWVAEQLSESTTLGEFTRSHKAFSREKATAGPR